MLTPPLQPMGQQPAAWYFMVLVEVQGSRGKYTDVPLSRSQGVAEPRGRVIGSDAMVVSVASLPLGCTYMGEGH